MKRFEEDFEEKFGESPTISNKMAHPEYKHMSATIIYLKNNLKREFHTVGIFIIHCMPMYKVFRF